MKVEMRFFAIFAIALVFLAEGCNPCAKLAKSKNISDKDSAAFCYYNRGKWESASLLLEELIGVYRGTPRAEDILYYYANSKLKMGDHVSAAHYFNEFTSIYPNSARREECMYLVGYSYAQMSNEHQLDQADTKKALQQLQYYVQLYPDGSKKEDANKAIKDLREKLAKKAFLQANLYLKISKYQAAAIAFKNVLSDFPDCQYVEESQFKMLKAQLLFAANSVEEKKEERLLEASAFYLKYLDKHPQGKHLRDAEAAYADVQKELAKVAAWKAGSKKKK